MPGNPGPLRRGQSRRYSQSTGSRLLLDIKAIPGSSKTEISGVKDGRLRIRIAAAPEDGKANASLCAFLAKTLGCAKRDVVIESGERSPLKTITLPESVFDALTTLIEKT